VLMAPIPSAEIESVMRRMASIYGTSDVEALSNLFSSDASLRVLGTSPDEWWSGQDEVLRVRHVQAEEMLGFVLDIEKVEAFEDGPFGWATMFFTLVTSEGRMPLRSVAVFRLEAGAWRAVHYHNSVPVSNQQIFGVALTSTLDGLVTSVLDGPSPFSSSTGSEGTMTLVFTDIVDSTVLAASDGDVAWAETVGRHEAAIRSITELHGGRVIKFLGDGSMLAFESARAAVRAAVDIQRATADDEFAVRIGIHTGEVIRTADDVLGLTVNKAARIASAAGAGEVMASSTTRDLAGSLDGVRIGESKIVALKGFSDTHQIVPLEWE
jgi:adenylate cyclase